MKAVATTTTTTTTTMICVLALINSSLKKNLLLQLDQVVIALKLSAGDIVYLAHYWCCYASI